jgi:hypothetical protein
MAGKPPLLPECEIGAEVCAGKVSKALHGLRVGTPRRMPKSLDEIRNGFLPLADANVVGSVEPDVIVGALEKFNSTRHRNRILAAGQVPKALTHKVGIVGAKIAGVAARRNDTGIRVLYESRQKHAVGNQPNDDQRTNSDDAEQENYGTLGHDAPESPNIREVSDARKRVRWTGGLAVAVILEG